MSHCFPVAALIKGWLSTNVADLGLRKKSGLTQMPPAYWSRVSPWALGSERQQGVGGLAIQRQFGFHVFQPKRLGDSGMRAAPGIGVESAQQGGISP